MRGLRLMGWLVKGSIKGDMEILVASLWLIIVIEKGKRREGRKWK
jgi:hypothetical protein